MPCFVELFPSNCQIQTEKNSLKKTSKYAGTLETVRAVVFFQYREL